MQIVLPHSYFLISGDIGGQMGLFIGASILTILEILDFVYEVRVHCFGPLFQFHIHSFEPIALLLQ